jgi:hypothetical protein
MHCVSNAQAFEVRSFEKLVLCTFAAEVPQVCVHVG